MANAVEILLKAKNDTDAAFKAVIKNLEGTQKEAKKTNDILGTISADLRGKLSNAAEDASGKLGGLGSSIAALGPVGLAAAATIGVVVAGIGAILKVSADAAVAAANYGDKIQDLADKTGLSAQAMQAFDVIARVSNTSIEAIAAGVLKMGRNIVDGSSAFKRLGLDLGELKKLSPEEQFKAVAVAIEGLGTSAEKSAARVAIFGKAGDEMAGALHDVASGATELGGALNDSAIKASAALRDQLDLMATAWERVLLQFGAAIAQSPDVQEGIKAITDALVATAEAIGDMAPYISGVFKFFRGEIDQTVAIARTAAALIKGDWVAALAEIRKAAEDTGKAIGAAVGGAAAGMGVDKPATRPFGPTPEEEAKARAALKRIADERQKRLETIAAQQAAMEKEEQKRFAAEQKRLEAIGAQRAAMDAEEQKRFAAEQKRLETIGAQRAAMDAEEDRRKEKERRDDEEAARRKEQYKRDQVSALFQLADAFQQFGAAADSTLVQITQGFAVGLAAINDWKSAANNAQKAMIALGVAQTAFSSGVKGGAVAGATFGAQFGPMGAAIGAVGGALLGFLGKAKKAREEMNKLRGEFVSSAGGMVTLSAHAKAAGISLDGLFKQKSAAALAHQIDTIKAKLAEWDEAQKVITDGMSKWGVTAAEMGPKFAQMELDKHAKEMILFFNAVSTVGGNVSAVTAKMAEDVNALINQYKAAGVAVPLAMRPMLELMLANKQLLDENGEAYDSFEEAGISFAQTMEGVLADVATEIKKLVEVLSRGLHIPVTYDVQQTGGGGGGGGGHPPANAPEFANAFVPYRPGGTLGYVGERADEYAIEEPRLQALMASAVAMAQASNGGSNGMVINVPVSIGTRQFGSVVAAVTRTRQGRIAPSAVQKF